MTPKPVPAKPRKWRWWAVINAHGSLLGVYEERAVAVYRSGGIGTVSAVTITETKPAKRGR